MRVACMHMCKMRGCIRLLVTCHTRRQLLRLDPELPRERAHDGVHAIEVRQRGRARHRLYPPHAGSDPGLLHDLERADLRAQQ